MMKKFAISILPLVLSACAGGPVKAPDGASAASEQTTNKVTKVTAPVVKATPLSAEVLYRLMAAEIAGQRGQMEVAVQEYYRVAVLSRDLDVVERAARIAVYARNDAISLKVGQLWLELEPSSIQALTVIATAQIKQDQYDDALQTLDRLLILTELRGQRGYHFIFTLLGRQRDKQAALDLLDKLMIRRGHTADALFTYGRLALLVGELEKSTTAVKKLLEKSPEWEDAQQLWVNLLVRKGQDEAALAFLQETIEAYPEGRSIRMYFARKLVDAKRLPDAHKQFVILLEQDSGNTDARYALGLLSLEMKLLDEAEEHFTVLYKDEERANESAYYLGQIAERRGKDDVATRWYSQVNKGQHLIEAQIRIAIMIAKAGDIATARKRLRNIEATNVAIELRLYLAEGDILRASNLYQEAFDLYSEALAKMPDNSQLLYARALTAEKIEQLEVTLQDLERIVKREPDNVQALNALGYTLADRTDRYEDALKYIQAAYKINSSDPAIIDSMGWIYYRMGHHQEALKYLQKAFAQLKDPEIGAHLGEVLWVMGEHQQARKIWDEALQNKPEHKILRNVIKRFTE